MPLLNNFYGAVAGAAGSGGDLELPGQTVAPVRLGMNTCNDGLPQNAVQQTFELGSESSCSKLFALSADVLQFVDAYNASAEMKCTWSACPYMFRICIDDCTESQFNC